MKNINSPQNNVIIQLHVAALLLGGTALFSKLVPYSAIDTIAYRSLICGLVLFAIASAMRHKILIADIRRFALLVFCSLLFTVHWTAYFHAMKVSTVAVGIISMFTFPVITVFLEPLVNKTKLHLRDILMGCLVLFGVSLLVPTFSMENQITEGVVFGVFSGFAVSVRNILVSKYLTKVSSLTIMTYHALITAAILLPLTSIAIEQIDLKNWMLLVLLGTIFTAIPHTQKTFALKYSSAKSVSMIISLQVVYASILAYFILSEAISIATIVGGSLILFAALYESVLSKK